MRTRPAPADMHCEAWPAPAMRWRRGPERGHSHRIVRQRLQSFSIATQLSTIPMTNLASILKAEIVRVSRREVRDEIKSLKKTTATQRSEIAALKKRAQALEQLVRKLTRGMTKTVAASTDEVASPRYRFSAERLAANRKRLNLSAADFGRLVGASGQSVYKWESGKVRPQAKQLTALAALKSIGKKQAQARLAEAASVA